MHRPNPRAARLLVLAATLCLLGFVDEDGDSVVMGDGAERFRWDRSWPVLDGGALPGPTHGALAVDAAGRIYLANDSAYPILVFDEEGTRVDAWEDELAGGLHGMQLVQEGDREFLYLAHHAKAVVVKATLAGKVLWRLGAPEESGLYGEGKKSFRPTSVAVAPDGTLFVADGYGASVIHVYDKERKWLRMIGTPGSEPGQFKTPHGITIDTRGGTPLLLVADRENSRLQTLTLEGEPVGVYPNDVRRPCSVSIHDELLVVADLNARVTVLDKDFALITHLGDNPEKGQWANYNVVRDDWKDGIFLAPHHATWDSRGNLYVTDWSHLGRVTRLERISGER